MGAQQPVTLRFAHAWQQDSPLFQATIVWWADEVTRRTDGRVRFEWYPLQTLLKAPETLEGIGQGVADVAAIAPGFLTGKLPLASIEGLPFAWPTLQAYVDGQQAMRQTLNDVEYAKFNTVLLGQTPLPYYIIGTKDRPVRALSDFRGLKLRSGGGVRAQNLQQAGAEPVFMPDAETYLALQRGIVDGYEGVWTNVIAQSLGEVTKSVTVTEHIASGGAVIINRNTWNKLPGEIQAVMLAAGRDMENRAVTMLPELDRQMMEQAVAKWGIQVHRLSREDMALWRAKSQAVWDQWLADRTAEGKGETARLLMGTVRRYSEHGKS